MNPAFLRRLGAVLALSFAAVAAAAAISAAAIAADPAGDDPKQELRHGSRAKAHDGTMVVYDKVTGVFVVPTRKNTFWIGNRFYQYDNGVWTVATAIAGPWELSAQHLVPDVAREKFSPPRTAVTAKLPSGVEAIYEPRLKVYRIAGKKGVFLFDGLFYRYDTGVWLESATDGGPWKTTSMKVLPANLRKAVPLPESGQKVALPSGEIAIYDSDGDFFFLEKEPATFLYDGTFYEKREGKWLSSSQASSGFKEVGSTGKVPANIRKSVRPGDKPKGERKRAAGDKPAAGKKQPAKNARTDKQAE